MRCNFFIVLFSCLIFTVNAQTYYFDNYTVKDGLNQSSICAIAQDSSGFLWMGNYTGCASFDGVSFKNYSTRDSMAGNGVRSMLIDRSGTIWFGHWGGGITIKKGDVFTQLGFDSLEINGEISGVAQDAEGDIWISTSATGAFQIHNPEKLPEEKIEFDHYMGKEGLSDRVFDVTADNAGNIYFVTDVGVKYYDAEANAFEIYSSENLSSFFAFTTIFFDSKGNKWFGTYNGGLYKEEASSGEVKIWDVKDGLAFNWISCINEDENGRIWVGTFGGGISMIEGERIITINQKNGLEDHFVFDIQVDRENNVLVGTRETGIFIFKGEHFLSYTEENGMSSDQVWAIQKDKYGKFWFGTSNGITIYDANSENKYSYISEERNNFISNDIRFIKEDRNGNLWIGSRDGGVIMVEPDKPNGPYFYPGRLNGNIPLQFVTSMDIDKDNNLWVGTIEGLIYYEIDNRALNYLTKSSGLAGNDISTVFCDSKGVVWVGSKGNGLTKIEGSDIIPLKADLEFTPSIIKEDNAGDIWVGTVNHGILQMKDRESIIETYSMEDGMLANFVNLLEIDADNNIWIGTNKGLNKYDRSQDDNKFKAYTEKDGFTGIETKSHASFKDDEGGLWFGTVKGAIVYDPSKDKTQSLLPFIQINRMRVNLNPLAMKAGQEFTYKEKSFYFDFKGIYLTNPSSVRYKYILEGLDAQWSEVTDLTFANYPSLPHGKYNFKVMATNNSGRWSADEAMATYSFVIKPPFWKTWWFYIFCVIFFGSWIIFLIKKREENLQREKKILEEKVAERTAEVVEKNKELASKNKDITDSIRYARRIQRAILPPDEMIENALTESFVYYRPKDIVSGDFYWLSETEDKVLYSAVDCTGHGVPGAFMSIVGHNLLDKIVKEEKIIQPSLILDELNINVSKTLRQTSEQDAVKDGMDMALISIDKKSHVMEFAGAHNGMYMISNGELIETKANRFAIGSFIRGEKKKFDNHQFQLKKGDIIYVFSDGFPDQFGGENGKKYKYKPFKQFLMDIHQKPMQEQMQLLEDEFVRWLGDYEQIDDVIVFGVRI